LFNNIGDCYYAAGSGSKPIVKFSNDDYTMFVDDILIDRIEAVPLNVTTSGARKEDSPLSLRDEWELWSLGKQPRDIYGDVPQQQEAYVHTITAGRNKDGSKGTCGFNAKTASIAFHLGFINEDEIDRIEYLEIRTSRSAANYSEFLSLHYESTFCTTKRGYMGRVHPETQAGDIIVIFAGAKVPHLLRKYKDDDRYFLIGDCCKFAYLSNLFRP
jgi:hypothetical protein